MHARFVRMEWENDARTLATVYLRPDRPYYFTAGQYADITLPHDHADQRGLTRTMTFSTSPSSKLLGFTTRFSRNNSTYKQALLALTPGSILTLTDSMGDMVLPLDSSVPLVFVAGGVGVASYISMVRWLSEQQDSRNVVLLYAVRNTDDIIFREVFDTYAGVGTLRQILYTTDNKASTDVWNGEIRQSRLTSQAIAGYLQPDSQIYISGAETMVEQLRTELVRDFAVAQYRVAYDYFDGYTEL